MKTYKLFNSLIASEIKLTNYYSDSEEEAEFNVFESIKSPITKEFTWYKRIYSEGKPWMSYATNGVEFGIRFHSTADFIINRDNRKIIFFRRKKTEFNTMIHLINDHIIPHALTLLDKTFFHSSAVRIGKYAVSFQAPSGSGKSTLAAYFSSKNYGLITDDSLLLEENNKTINAYPSYPGIKLWPENIEKIFNNGIKSKMVSQFNNKRLIDNNINFEKNLDNPFVLKSIYFINNSDHTDIELINPTEAFSLIIKNIFRLNYKDKKINKLQFDFISKILNTVELYKLNYKKEYESLNKVFNLVTDRTIN